MAQVRSGRSAHQPVTAGDWDRWYSHSSDPHVACYPLARDECALFELKVGLPRPGTTAVDIGCGTGDWTRVLATLDLTTVYGYDLSPVAIHRAKALGRGESRARFATWDIARCALPPDFDLVPGGAGGQKVDLVTLRHSAAYVGPQGIRRAAHWLTEGGRLYVLTAVDTGAASSDPYSRGMTAEQIEDLCAGWQYCARYQVGDWCAVILRHPRPEYLSSASHRAGCECGPPVLQAPLCSTGRAEASTSAVVADIAAMRDTAAQVLEGAPSDEDVRELVAAMRGHFAIVLPDIEDAARRLDPSDVRRGRALRAVRSTRTLLNRYQTEAGRALGRDLAHRLLTSCDTHDELAGRSGRLSIPGVSSGHLLR